jgi:hypothetical protein
VVRRAALVAITAVALLLGLGVAGVIGVYGWPGQSTNLGVYVNLPWGHDAGLEVWGHPGFFVDTF